MAKKMSKAMALLLAASISTSQVVLPAVATENSTPNPEATLTITPLADPAPAPAPVEPSTTTVVSDPVTNADGSVTTTTTTTTVDPANNTTTSSTNTETTNSIPDGQGGGVHTVDGSTSTTSVTTSSDPVNKPNDGTVTKTESTYDSTSTETLNGGAVDIHNVSNSASETWSTTTSTEITEDTKLDVDVVPGTIPGEQQDTDQVKSNSTGVEADKDVTDSDTKWVSVKITDRGPLSEEQIYDDGEVTLDPSKTSDSTINFSSEDDLNASDEAIVIGVKEHQDDPNTPEDESRTELMLKPTAETDKGYLYEQREVVLNQIMSGRYTEIYDPSTIEGGSSIQFEKKTETVDGKSVTYWIGSNGKGVTVRFDENENGWIVTKTTEIAGDRSKTEEFISDSGTPGQASSTDSEVSAYDPELVARAATYETDKNNGVDIPAAEGSTAKEYKYVETLYGNDGTTVAGYKDVVKTVTTTVSDPVRYDIDNNSAYPDELANIANNGVAVPGFTMPDKSLLPAAGIVDNGDGTVTETVIGTMYDPNGTFALNVGDEMGYSISIITYKADDLTKTPIKSSLQKIYGTATSTTTTTTLDPTTMEVVTTTEVVHEDVKEIHADTYTRTTDIEITQYQSFDTTVITEQDSYQWVSTAGGMYFMYKGKMFEVKEVVNTDNGKAHGSYTNPTTANKNNIDHSFGKQDDIQNTGFANFKGETTGHLITGDDNTYGGDGSNSTWDHTGAGLVSTFFLRDNGVGNKNNEPLLHQAQQFRIEKDGEVRYVYCVELGTSASGGSYYSKTDGNGVSGTNYVSGDIENLRSVAINGFWGTNAGIGSLSAVKDLLMRNGYEDEANSLTAGEALAATQAAFWNYGAQSGAKFENNFVALDNSVGWNPSDVDNIYTLRNLLIRLADTDASDGRTGAAQELNAENITGSAITLHNTTTITDTATNTTVEGYTSDVSFQLNISHTSLNGNVDVIMTQGDRNIGTFKLASTDGSFLTSIGRVRADGDGVYTIPNVELIPGQPVTLKLQGVQHLDDGIYVYNNSSKQDFIGLSSYEHNIALQFDVQFDVIDPYMTNTDHTTSGTRKDYAYATQDAVLHESLTVTTNEEYDVDYTNYDYDAEIYGTTTAITVVDSYTKEEMTMEEYLKRYLPAPIDDEDGGGGGGGGVVLLNDLVPLEAAGLEGIPDEGVPLAAAPGTGDASLIWGILGTLSMGGYTFLGRKNKKEDEEA